MSPDLKKVPTLSQHRERVVVAVSRVMCRCVQVALQWHRTQLEVPGDEQCCPVVQVVRTTTQALLVLTDRLSALDMVLSCGAHVLPSVSAFDA